MIERPITEQERQAFFEVCKNNGISISKKPQNIHAATIKCGNQLITFSDDLKVKRIVKTK